MLINDVPVNASIELLFEYNKKIQVLQSQVICIKGDIVGVSAILEGDKVIHPKKLKDIEVLYKCDMGLYTFKNIEVNMYKYEDRLIYGIKCSENAKKENRRESYRVYFGELKQVRIFNDGEEECVYGILKDLSSSGMAIIINKTIEMGSILEVEHNTGKFKLRLQGKVLRSEELMNGKGILYGCRFRETNNILNQYLMDKQCEEIKRKRFKREFFS